jgi:hypothetical protein
VAFHNYKLFQRPFRFFDPVAIDTSRLDVVRVALLIWACASRKWRLANLNLV